jgi:hypothetical protein
MGFIGYDGSSKRAFIAMRRWGDDKDFFYMNMDVRDCFRWRARNGQNQKLVDQALAITCDPAIDGAHVQLIFNAERDPQKPQRIFVESLKMRDGQFVAEHQVMALDYADEEWARRAA